MTPHDAEEALRPHLGRLYDAEQVAAGKPSGVPGHVHALRTLTAAQADALEAALGLLGVSR